MTHYDLIIRNGEIIDGTGNPSFTGDIAIKAGLIERVEPAIDATATQEIDARDKLVTPGFVDVHTHYDGQATWDSHMKPSSSLGTTTVVMGNCGVGFAPCRKEDHEVLVQLMEGVEEIPGTAMNEGLPWNWESFPEFLDSLDAKPRDIDVAALFPHSPLRVYVMGERAVNREPATDADIEKMQSLLAEGLAAGAMGFSTSRTFVHLSSTGESIPTFMAATQELKQLGEMLSGRDGHVFQMISDWKDAADEFSILKHTSEKTGAKSTFTLLYNDHEPEVQGDLLARIEAAQAEKLDIRGQVLSRPIGMLMGHPASMHAFSGRPTFMQLDHLPFREKINALKDPGTKARILAEQNEPVHIFVKLFGKRFQDMYPMEEPINYLPEKSSSVAAQAERDGRDPAEWLYDYFLGNDGNNLVYLPVSNFSDRIPELLTHPYTVPALGDGGAHVGSICDTSANLFVLTKWVKEMQQIPLSQAIHLLTRRPAELYSLKDRGLIAKGMKADVNVIDFSALSLHTPHIVNDLPGGGRRFLQRADGIEATIKSGEVIFRNGEATGALPGKLVRGQQSQPTA